MHGRRLIFTTQVIQNDAHESHTTEYDEWVEQQLLDEFEDVRQALSRAHAAIEQSMSLRCTTSPGLRRPFSRRSLRTMPKKPAFLQNAPVKRKASEVPFSSVGKQLPSMPLPPLWENEPWTGFFASDMIDPPFLS